VLHRYDDWPSRLHSYLETRRYASFAYGSHDCCLFVADAIVAMTGIDLAASFRNTYQSGAGALRRIYAYSAFATVEDLVATIFREHGLPEIPPARAARGDTVLLPENGHILGLISLSGSVLAAAERGWLAYPAMLACRAWKV
jgi:uncharacterized protein DUF6950